MYVHIGLGGPKNFGDVGVLPPLWCGAWLTLSNTLLPHMITIPDLVTQGRWGLHVDGCHKIWTLGPPHLGWRPGWPLEMPVPRIYYHICYHTIFNRFQLNYLGISRVPKKFGDAGAHPVVMKYASPPVCYCTKFSHPRSNCMSVIMEITRKFWPSTSHLSWSLKVIGTDMDWLTFCDFLLVIHSNHWPVSYFMEIKNDNCKILPPLCI